MTTSVEDSIRYVTYFLGLLAPLFLLPLIVAIYFRDLRESIAFSVVFLILISFWIFSRKNIKIQEFNKSQQLLSLFFMYFVAALICSIPFLFAGFGFFDAIFDAMAQLTTTGVSLYSGSVSQSLSFFRSFLAWVGGFGFIFFASIVLGGAFQQAELKTYFNKIKEIKGLSFKSFPKKIFGIYVFLTVICIFLLLLSGMPLFDSINLAMGTLSTAGVLLHAPFSDIQKILLIVFMLLGATCFILFLIRKNFIKVLLNNIEFRAMLILIALGTSVFVFLSKINPIDSVFLATSVLSGTGFIPFNINISQLSSFAMFIMLGLIIIGGSYSSTTGGLKLWRVIIFFKTIFAEIKKYLLPENTVVPITFEHQPIRKEESYEIFIYISIFFAFLLISTGLFLIFDHLDLFQSLFTSAALISSAGVTPVNISSLSFVSQCLSFFLMWIGRIELLGFLVFIGLIF